MAATINVPIDIATSLPMSFLCSRGHLACPVAGWLVTPYAIRIAAQRARRIGLASFVAGRAGRRYAREARMRFGQPLKTNANVMLTSSLQYVATLKLAMMPDGAASVKQNAQPGS
jgi:hypothetical protein